MKRTLSLLLALCMTVTAFAFTASAQSSYSPEVGDGYISFDFNIIQGGIVNNLPNANIQKNVTIEGVSAVKITPTPGSASGAAINLDCHKLADFASKVEIPKYKYVGVTYYYDTDNPTFDGNLRFRYLPGSTKAVSEKWADSTEGIVTNKWAEAIFNFSDVALSPNAPKNHLQQVHLRPFGDTDSTTLSEDDVIYIARYTFYEKNPNPNASTKLSFYKAHLDAVGEDGKVFEVKSGESFTLPAADTFTLEGGEFKGWLCVYDNKTYSAGDSITVGDSDLKFNAVWASNTVSEDYLALDFSSFEGGVVNHVDTATLETVEKDGRTATLIIPNPDATGGVRIAVDSFWNGAGVNLDVYRWAVVEYLYESPSPVENVQMFISPMKLGGIMTIDRYSVLSKEPIVEGVWANALFDLSGIGEVLNPSASNHNMNQLHLRPFAEHPVKELTVNDKMYIGKITFFKEKPAFETHVSYMNGYSDGSFKPSGTMTRAEACTVIARLLEAEENISGTSAFSDVTADAWFAKYIGFCEAKGLLKSYSGSFLPNQPITRAEFSELVYLTGLATDKGIKAEFTDVAASHPKHASIMAAASAGLINGYANGDGTFSFKPDATITRAEVVTVINRARGLSKKSDTVSPELVILFTDVDTTHWAFADIAEATVQHVEQDGRWLYASVDPVSVLAEKVDLSTIYNTAEGYAEVARLDEREAQRIEEIRGTANMDLSNIVGKKIYVSSSLGNDSNDGLSPERAVKTIAKANTLAEKNGAVLLCRGDLWREPFTARANVLYTAYGEGAKPEIYASPENGADSEKWFLVHEDTATGALIWQYANTDLRDVGTLVLNEGEGFSIKEHPSSKGSEFFVRGTKNKTKFDWKKELDRNFEHFHAANSAASDVILIDQARGPLYFRCDNGNPGKVFDSIEFNVKDHIIKIGGDNVTIDNLCLKYTGAHGISSGNVKNLTVTNCEIGWIGGSIQSYNANGNSDGSSTRYGNGVEVYGSCDGYTVHNCYIYQCYDAGVTHQLSGRTLVGDYHEDNIEYSNNLITDCVYSIEYFLGVPEGDASLIREGKNVLFKENLLRRAGFGFGSVRPDTGNQRHIRSGGSVSQDRFSNFRIEGNIFDRAVEELVDTSCEYKVHTADYEGNTYIQGIGNNLYTHSTSGKGRMDIASPYAISNVLGDKTARIYYVDYIPVYSYSYTLDKTAEVTAEDRVPKVSADKDTEEESESIEIVAPLLVRTTKAKTLYGAVRNSYTVEVKNDDKAGISYSHVNILDNAAALNMDCFLPKYSIETPSVYFKILMRTNQEVQPHVIVYSMVDADGNKVGNGAHAVSSEKTSGNGEWEEIIVRVSDFPEGAVTSTQIHLMFAGNSVKGSAYYENGKLKDDAYFDIAAWAAFPNLASAKAFDLMGAAK